VLQRFAAPVASHQLGRQEANLGSARPVFVSRKDVPRSDVGYGAAADRLLTHPIRSGM
jgi:hypothetical protein